MAVEVDDAQDVFAAASVAQIHEALGQLHDQEASVTQRLNALIASQKDLSRELGRLDLLRARLGTQAVNTRAISNGMLSDAASTANRISSAVKRLDQEQSNVKATLDVVEQVAELKACVLGVHGSMGAPQDWETAAAYLSRAAKVLDAVVDGSFAEEMVPTAEVPDPPRVTLDAAAESLCGLFLREFEKAAGEGDGSKVTRFFKLFPLIGRTDVGLDAYGRYVCQGVASRARANFNSAAPAQRNEGFFYGNIITKLFEHIAQIVDGHEPLVERHYGRGMMQKVIERLQIEADVQGGIVLDTWHEERHIDRKLTEIKSYAFSFLVQSFLPAKPTNGTPRSSSPANGGVRTSEDQGVDMKEIDSLLGEGALILGRYALYARFLSDKCAPSEPEDRIDYGLVMPNFLATSNLHKKVSSHLIDPFNAMTTFFFRRSVEKAFQLDESPSDLTLNPSKPLGSNPPFITSAVDDVMYIVNQVLQRTLATSQRAVVSSVVPAVSHILGSEFIGMIQRKMRDESYPKPVIQGGLPPEDKVIAFLVLINNLDIANDYVKRIVHQQLGSQAQNGGEIIKSPLHDLFPFGHDATFVENTLKSMEKAFASKSGDLLNDGITVLFTNVLKPRIRPILAEAFRDIKYDIEEDDINGDDEEEDVDVVKSRFDRGWGIVIRPIKRILTSANFDRLLSLGLNYLASALEKRIRSYYGRVNELGAVRLERDVAGIIAAATSGGAYSLRDAFQKCTQMTLILNMEDDEFEDVADDTTGDSGISWVMDAEERKRIFENTWPSTLDTTIAWRGWSNSSSMPSLEGPDTSKKPEELTFVITGDIEAMWLRDSANQLQAYISVLKKDDSPDSLASLFRGAINLQARYILEFPFCNAFQAPEESGIPQHSSMNSDRITPAFDYYKVFSCQWELDSVASFLQLSVDYVTATHDYDFFARSSNWTAAVKMILETTDSMMIDSYAPSGEWQHTPYTYCAPYGGTPINNCNGSPHKGHIGLIRSFQRPSDDACTYQYLIPSNMMFSSALNTASNIMQYLDSHAPTPNTGNLTTRMRKMSTNINRGIEKYGIVNDANFGRIYAYEVDGYGSAVIMDDPNIPSLLSAPAIGYTTLRDPIYANTRRKLLSRQNPYYAVGEIITGIASPHTLPGRPWPMALIMTILTSVDDEEIVRNLMWLVQSTDGLGLMHESVHAKEAGVWSRQWFSWANGLFGQMILDLERRKPWILRMSFQ
ncbi:hypothetical protein PTNB29_05337 [Pyrenophora teres f. teres]|nr:hypothetical protein PTNB29_05337 [Pyrenophora teres f. teres]